MSAVMLGILPMIACGSDRSSVTTAPTSALLTTPFDQSVITATSTPLVITSLVSGTSCPTLQFKISTYVFLTSATTKYEGGTCASLQPGTALTTFSGSRPSPTDLIFYVSQITIQSSSPTPAPAPAPAPTPVTTDGTVTSVVSGTSCPNLQFMFGTYLFKISAATAYSQASCADVKVGVHVYVAGTKREGDSFILVTGLGIKRDTTSPSPTAPAPAPKPTPAPEPAPTSFETTVSVSTVVAGSACPYREFMVGDYRLTTSAVTRYENGSCADIVPGAALAIVATKGKSDGSVLVSTVTFEQETDPEPFPVDEISADVTVGSLLAGSECPALSFLVGAYTVTASSTTRYEGGMCTDLAPGRVVHLSGTELSDDHVLASRLSFPR